MSDSFEFDDEQSQGQQKAGFKAITAYMIRRWLSHPGKLAGFLALFMISVACDLALPIAAGHLVESLSAETPARGTLGPVAQAVWSSWRSPSGSTCSATSQPGFGTPSPR
jgi:hypothetical protein